MLTKLMAEQQPDLMVLAFDKSRHTFRTERYADYKGTRDKTPEELLSQFPLLREFAANMGIPFLEKDNYEADDIIGTLATQAAAKGYDVRVITGDRDALQLVRPNLRVLLTKKGISEIKDYDTAAFEEEYGFERLSKELATIELHVPDLAFAEEDYRIQPDMEKMQAFCDDHELRAVWRNFERLYGPAELALDLDGGENGAAAQDLSYDLWDEEAVKTAAKAPFSPPSRSSASSAGP